MADNNAGQWAGRVSDLKRVMGGTLCGWVDVDVDTDAGVDVGDGCVDRDDDERCARDDASDGTLAGVGAALVCLRAFCGAGWLAMAVQGEKDGEDVRRMGQD